MKKTFIMLSIFFCAIQCIAQKNNNEKLKIGDKVPDVAFTVHIGDSVRRVHLSDYKGKVVIFDNWNIHCPTCIASMPEMLDLQQYFNDKIQVIFIRHDKQTEIQKMWETDKFWSPKIIRAVKKLTFLNEDSILLKMFPIMAGVAGVKMWIDQEQIFRAASEDHATVLNVQDFLNGHSEKLSKTVIWDKFPDGWLLTRFPFASHSLSYTIFTKYDEGWGDRVLSEIEKDSSSNNVQGFYGANMSIYSLYKIAYSDSLPFHCVLQTYDSSKYVDKNPFWDINHWKIDNEFCYLKKIKSAEPNNIFKLMRTDLDQFFKLNSTVETRRIKCWVLNRSGNTDKIKTNGFSPVNKSVPIGDDSYKRVLINQQMSALQNEIVQFIPVGKRIFEPFKDETNYKYNIDIEIPEFDQSDSKTTIVDLQRALKNYGLDLVEEYRNMKVLVLREKNYQGPEIAKINSHTSKLRNSTHKK